MKPEVDTKSAILGFARDYLQTRGFNAFSFQHLAERLKIRKASIHYHFRSKEELGVALIERYREAFIAWHQRDEVKTASPIEKLSLFFALFETFANDGAKLCPGGVLCSDYHTLPAEMQEGLRALQTDQKTWLGSLFRAGIGAGDFREDISPEQATDLVLSSMQGALQLARVRGTTRCFRNVAVSLRTMLLTK